MDDHKKVPVVLVTEQVEAVEPVGAWGAIIEPKNLTFAQLKFHVKARGQEPFGLRTDLELELHTLLQAERDAARHEYFAKRKETRANFRELVGELKEANPEFKLEDVHGWLHDERRYWDWDDDERSLAHRQRQLRRKFPTALVRRSRNPFPEEPSERQRRAIEKAVERERIKELKDAELNKERTCTWEIMRADDSNDIDTGDGDGGAQAKRVRAHYCTNLRQKLSRERNADHADSKFCAFHAKLCNGGDHSVAIDSTADAVKQAAAKKMAKRPPVRTPNELGLCTECFFKVRMRRPVAMEAHAVPGVLQRNHEEANDKRNKNGQANAGYEDLSKYQTGALSGVMPNLAMREFWCQWKAKDPANNVFACCNVSIRHPMGDRMTTRCGFHTKTCGMSHVNQNVTVEHPNELGICDRHYEAKRRCIPASDWPLASTVILMPGVYMDTIIAEEPVEKVYMQDALFAQDMFTPIADNVTEADSVLTNDERPQTVPAKVWNYAKHRIKQKATALTNAMIVGMRDAVSEEGQVIRQVIGAIIAPVSDMVRERTNIRARQRMSIIPRPRAIMRRAAAPDSNTIVRGLADDIKKKYGLVEQHEVIEIYRPLEDDLASQKTTKMTSAARRTRIRAARMLQRVYRGTVARKSFDRHVRALSIQRLFRGHQGRAAAQGEYAVHVLRAADEDRAWASNVVGKHLMGHAARIRVRKMRAYLAVRRNAAKCIQRTWVHSCMRQIIKLKLMRVGVEARAARVIQQQARIFIAQMRVFYTLERRHSAATGLHRLWRGLKGREYSARCRADMEEVWRWVGSHQSNKRDHLSVLLRRDRYRTTNEVTKQNNNIDDEEAQQQESTTDLDVFSPRVEQAQVKSVVHRTIASVEHVFAPGQPEWDTRMFKNFDPEVTGILRRDEMARVLHAIPGSSILFSDAHVDALLRLWSKTDGLVNYLDFLRYARAEQNVCSAHRHWVCPLCVAYGHCDKCLCTDFTAKSRVGPRSLICTGCGHYRSLHKLVPPSRTDIDFVKGASVTRKQMLQILDRKDPFKTEVEAWRIKRSRIVEKGLTFQFRLSDLDPSVKANNSVLDSNKPNSNPAIKRADTAKLLTKCDRATIHGQQGTGKGESDSAVEGEGGEDHAREVVVQAIDSPGEASEHMQRLCATIISDIVHECKNRVARLTMTTGWNKSTDTSTLFNNIAVAERKHKLKTVNNMPSATAAATAAATAPRPATVDPAISSVPRARGMRMAAVDGASGKKSIGDIGNEIIKRRPRTAFAKSHRRPRTSRRGVTRPPTSGAGTTRTKTLGPLRQLSVMEADRESEVERANVFKIGKLLIESAKVPHAMVHHGLLEIASRQRRSPDEDERECCGGGGGNGSSGDNNNNNNNSSHGNPRTYVNRAYHAELRRKQLVDEIGQFKTSLRALRFEFTVTDPVPFIVNDQLKMTTNVTSLYLDMLIALSSPACRLLEDRNTLAAYIFQSFSFLQRHWRKLVHDLRTGTVDQNLPIDPTTRTQVEMSLTPEPERAKVFDNMLREVGFYKYDASTNKIAAALISASERRPSTTDGTTGKRRRGAPNANLVPDIRNRSNLVPDIKSRPLSAVVAGAKHQLGRQEEPDSEMQRSWQDSVSNVNNVRLGDTSSSHLIDPKLSRLEKKRGQDGLNSSWSLSRSRSNNQTTHDEERHNTVSCRSISSRSRNRRSRPNSIRPATSSSYHQLNTKSTASLPDLKGRTSNKSQAQERGGAVKKESDISSRQLDPHAHAYQLLTRPRTTPARVRQVSSRHTRPFRCSHPGCGRSFTDQWNADKHAREAHYGRVRLAVKTERNDELLRSFWPSQVPWDGTIRCPTADEEKTIALQERIDKPYVCPRKLVCSKRFPTAKECRLHVQSTHEYQEKMEALHGYVETHDHIEMAGDARVVPPQLPPRRVGVPCCSKHWILMKPYCDVCVEIMKTNQPLAPLKFYNSVRVPLREVEGIPDLQPMNLHVDGVLAVELLVPRKTTSVPTYTTLPSSSSSLTAPVLAITSEPESSCSSLDTILSSNHTRRPSNQSIGEELGTAWSRHNSSNQRSVRNRARRRSSGRRGAGGESNPQKVSVLAHIVALFSDKLGRKFVAYSRLCSAQEVARVQGMAKVSELGLDIDDELVETLQVEFAPLADIVAAHYVLNCDIQEFQRRKREETLPTRLWEGSPVLFSHKLFCSSSGALLGDRGLLSFQKELVSGVYVAEVPDGGYGVSQGDFYEAQRMALERAKNRGHS